MRAALHGFLLGGRTAAAPVVLSGAGAAPGGEVELRGPGSAESLRVTGAAAPSPVPLLLGVFLK